MIVVQVRVEGDDVIVRAEKKVLGTTRRTRESVVASAEDDQRTFLIIGGGVCVCVCVWGGGGGGGGEGGVRERCVCVCERKSVCVYICVRGVRGERGRDYPPQTIKPTGSPVRC